MERIIFAACLIVSMTLSSCERENDQVEDIKIEITSNAQVEDQNTYTLTAKIEAKNRIKHIEVELRSLRNSYKSVTPEGQSINYDLSQVFYLYEGENLFTIRTEDQFGNIKTATITVNNQENAGIPLCENLEDSGEQCGFKWVMTTPDVVVYSGNFVWILEEEYRACKFRKDVKKLYDNGSKRYEISLPLSSIGRCLISKKNDIYFLVQMNKPMFVLY